MSVEVSIKDVKVMIGIPAKGGCPRATMNAIAGTMYQAGLKQLDVTFLTTSASNNDRARDLVADQFLKSECDKLFWIDSDIVWNYEDFFKLVAYSTLVDVVMADYQGKLEPPVWLANFDNPCETNELGLMKVNGAGFGFVCMDRKVVQAVADMSPECYSPRLGKRKKIFRHDIAPNGWDRTEDFAFFADAMECGFDLWLDPHVELGHMGEKEWRGRFSDAVKLEKIEDDAA